MALDFHRLMSRTPKEKKISECRLRINLATACLKYASSNAEKANESVYSALSHLAEIPECEITIESYDRLRYQYDLPFDTEAFLLAKEKLKFLEEFKDKLILEGDDNLVNFK